MIPCYMRYNSDDLTITCITEYTKWKLSHNHENPLLTVMMVEGDSVGLRRLNRFFEQFA